MPQDDPVQKALTGAKQTLANANKFTQSVEGNPTSHFSAPALKKPNIPQAHKQASYGLAREARDAGEGVKNRMEMEDAARKSISEQNQ